MGLVCSGSGLRSILDVNYGEHDNSSPVCWLERFPYKEDVIGSSPVGPTPPTGSDWFPLPDRSVVVGLFLVQLFLRFG